MGTEQNDAEMHFDFHYPQYTICIIESTVGRPYQMSPSQPVHPLNLLINYPSIPSDQSPNVTYKQRLWETSWHPRIHGTISVVPTHSIKPILECRNCLSTMSIQTQCQAKGKSSVCLSAGRKSHQFITPSLHDVKPPNVTRFYTAPSRSEIPHLVAPGHRGLTRSAFSLTCFLNCWNAESMCEGWMLMGVVDGVAADCASVDHELTFCAGNTENTEKRSGRVI